MPSENKIFCWNLCDKEQAPEVETIEMDDKTKKSFFVKPLGTVIKVKTSKTLQRIGDDKICKMS